MSIGQSSNRISHLSLARHVAAALPKEATPSDRLVAVLLASYAGPDGGGIRPSLASLVDLSGLSRRSVLRCLANLKGWGLLVDDGEHRYGPGNMWVRVRAFDLNVVLERHQGVPRESPVVTRVTPLDPLGGDSGDTTGGDSGDTQISLKGTSIESERREVPPSSVPPIVAISGPQHIRSPKGSRLADDWQPSDSDLDFAKSLGLAPEAVLDQFTDYWHARAGSMAVKLDWHATWRNWCRKEAASRPRSNGHAKESRHAWVTKALRGELPHEAWEDAL